MTPQGRAEGRIYKSGIRRITFLKKAKKKDILPSPHGGVGLLVQTVGSDKKAAEYIDS